MTKPEPPSAILSVLGKSAPELLPPGGLLPLGGRVQEELEFLGTQELKLAIRNLMAETSFVGPGVLMNCKRMAIAPTGGPNGEIYKVVVSVVCEPTRGHQDTAPLRDVR